MLSTLCSDITLIQQAPSAQTMPVGQILLRKRWLTSQQLATALELQSSYRLLLGEVLLRCGYVKSHQIEKALQEQKWRGQGFWVIN